MRISSVKHNMSFFNRDDTQSRHSAGTQPGARFSSSPSQAGTIRHSSSGRKSKQVLDLYSKLDGRKGLNGSDHHRRLMQTWIRDTAITFETGSSAEKLDCLKNLVNTFCRPLDECENANTGSDPRYINTVAVAGLYSAQKAVLKILAHNIKQLDPEDQYELLQGFIETNLEHMGHTLEAAHDPQRKAIKMLAKLLPALKVEVVGRVNLSPWLFSKLNEGKINMDPNVGGLFNRKPRQTSDVAAQLVGKELRLASRQKSKLINASTLTDIQRIYDQALADYASNSSAQKTRLHTDAWKRTFDDVRLNPSSWSTKRPKKLVKRSAPEKFLNLKIIALRQQNQLLKNQLDQQAQSQGALAVHGWESGEYEGQVERTGSVRTQNSSQLDVGIRSQTPDSINDGFSVASLRRAGGVRSSVQQILVQRSNRTGSSATTDSDSHISFNEFEVESKIFPDQDRERDTSSRTASLKVSRRASTSSNPSLWAPLRDSRVRAGRDSADNSEGSGSAGTESDGSIQNYEY